MNSHCNCFFAIVVLLTCQRFIHYTSWVITPSLLIKTPFVQRGNVAKTALETCSIFEQSYLCYPISCPVFVSDVFDACSKLETVINYNRNSSKVNIASPCNWRHEINHTHHGRHDLIRPCCNYNYYVNMWPQSPQNSNNIWQKSPKQIKNIRPQSP